MGDTVPLDHCRQTIAHPPRMLDHRRRSPRLPTPEASRSSNGSLDEQVPRTYARNGMRICALLSNDHSDRERHNTAPMREDTRYRPAPRSPPYHSVDSQKPSLPPLKTVLNGTISSPPDTPPAQQGAFQPGPREPIFSASTYKPPALYPNKKLRTEAGPDSSLTINTRGSLASPGLPTASIDHGHGRSFQRPSVSHRQSASHSEYDNDRRQSLYQSVPSRPDRTPPERKNYYYSREPVDGARPQRMSVSISGPYRSPEQAAFPLPRSEEVYTQPRQPVEYFAASGSDRYALPSDRTMSRRSSAVSPRGIDPHPMSEASRGGYTPTRSSHFTLPMRDDSGSFREQHHFERDRSQHLEVYGRPGYPEAQPTFFMPSHYDYQQGKTRKRSNLPKQSTEIMKNWFDQNIANPYPSEDQKAVFSNATGISMTQVSNWFINHRRRCPELRDKRDKTRVIDGGV